MKIAFFNYLMLEYGGGLAEYFITVASGLSKRYPNLEISIITLDEKLIRKIASIYAFYYGTKNYLPPLSVEASPVLTRRLTQVNYIKVNSFADLRKTLARYDVVYSKNDFIEAYILKLFIGKNYLKKLIFGFHTPVLYERVTTAQDKLHNFIYNSFLYSYAINLADGLHVLNNFDLQLLSRRFSQKKIVKIYNPFDKSDFIVTNHKKNVRCNILWIGRLTKEKGIEDLFWLINELNNKQADKFNWTIIGEGSKKSLIVKLQQRWKNVRYLGSVPHEFISKIYAESDLYVTTSKFECFPYTVLEAQSSGIPVISYNIHGCNDIIIDNKTGFLVSSKEAFKGKIMEFLTIKIFKSNEIQRSIEERFNQESSYKALYKLFITI